MVLNWSYMGYSPLISMLVCRMLFMDSSACSLGPSICSRMGSRIYSPKTASTASSTLTSHCQAGGLTGFLLPSEEKPSAKSTTVFLYA